jgi:hypothetical protein
MWMKASLVDPEFIHKLDAKYARDFTEKLVNLGPHKCAGTEREREAASVISAEMEKIGLERVCTEPFPVYIRDPSAGASLRTLDPEENFSAFPMASTFPTSNDGISAEIVYVGSGKATDFDKVKVDDRVVLARRDWPDMFWGGEEDTYYRIRPVIEAWVRKASAVVVFDDLAPDDMVRTQLYGMYSSDLDIPVVCIPKNVAEHLISLCQKGPVKVNVKSKIQKPTLGFSQNVFGLIEGSKHPNQYVVIASHFDTWWNGAVDSLSGIGCLVAIARAMKEAGVKSQRTIVFMAHGSEEAGSPGFYEWLTGSYSHIFVNHPDWVGKTVAELNIDCVGFSESDFLIETTPELFATIMGVVRSLHMKPKSVTSSVPVSSLTFVDSASYVFAGVPSASMMFFPDEMWKYYHTPRDAIDLVTEESLFGACKLWGAAAMHIANSPLPAYDFSETGKAVSAALRSARQTLEKAGEKQVNFSVVLKAAQKLAAVGSRLREIPIDDSEEEKARLMMKAASRLNREIYLVGGTCGFNMFFLPIPYVADTVPLKSALNCLKKGRISNAIQELERTSYMRNGRYNSYTTNNKMYDLMRPANWATRVQSYADVYPEWYSLKLKLQQGEKRVLPELKQLQERYEVLKLDLETSLSQVASTINGSIELLEDAIRLDREVRRISAPKEPHKYSLHAPNLSLAKTSE